MGSNESHFNVSLIVRVSNLVFTPSQPLRSYQGEIVKDKVARQCPQATNFEEKGEPKRIQTEVPLLTSLTPYHYAKPAHSLRGNRQDLLEINAELSVVIVKTQYIYILDMRIS